MFEYTEIAFGPVRILEPVTALTDLLTAGVCFRAYHRLQPDDGAPGYRLMRRFFLFTGLAVTASAVFGHAFQEVFSPSWKLLGWTMSALGVMYAGLGSLEMARLPLTPEGMRSLRWIFLGQFAVFLVLVGHPVTRSYGLVQMNAAAGLGLAAGSLQAYGYFRDRAPWRLTFLTGLGIGALTGQFFASKSDGIPGLISTI